MKTLFTRALIMAFMIGLVATAASATVMVTDLNISDGQLEIKTDRKFTYEFGQPDDSGYAYVDIFEARTDVKLRYHLEEGQGFNQVRVGRHGRPLKVRIVLQGADKKYPPKVDVEETEKKLVLSWPPTSRIPTLDDPKPKNISRIKSEQQIDMLVEKVSGEPVKKPKLAEIDARPAEKPKVKFINDEKEENDILSDLANDVTSAVNGVSKWWSGSGEANAKEPPKAQKVVKAEVPKLPIPKEAPEVCDAPKEGCAAAQQVNIDQQLNDLRVWAQTGDSKVKKSTKQMLDKAVAKLEKKIAKQGKAQSDKVLQQWQVKNKAKLTELDKLREDLKLAIADVHQKRDELEETIREINTRNMKVICREEPQGTFQVVFLPAGSFRVGLDAFAKSYKLALEWDAPHNDYYIDRAIMLNGATFADNLMIIHQALAQNEVYFMLEPNFATSQLRIRVSEIAKAEDSESTSTAVIY